MKSLWDLLRQRGLLVASPWVKGCPAAMLAGPSRARAAAYDEADSSPICAGSVSCRRARSGSPPKVPSARDVRRSCGGMARAPEPCRGDRPVPMTPVRPVHCVPPRLGRLRARRSRVQLCPRVPVTCNCRCGKPRRLMRAALSRRSFGAVRACIESFNQFPTFADVQDPPCPTDARRRRESGRSRRAHLPLGQMEVGEVRVRTFISWTIRRVS